MKNKKDNVVSLSISEAEFCELRPAEKEAIFRAFEAVRNYLKRRLTENEKHAK